MVVLLFCRSNFSVIFCKGYYKVHIYTTLKKCFHLLRRIYCRKLHLQIRLNKIFYIFNILQTRLIDTITLFYSFYIFAKYVSLNSCRKVNLLHFFFPVLQFCIITSNVNNKYMYLISLLCFWIILSPFQFLCIMYFQL